MLLPHATLQDKEGSEIKDECYHVNFCSISQPVRQLIIYLAIPSPPIDLTTQQTTKKKNVDQTTFDSAV